MDRDFTPTADMLVHEFDDEATLDEEEEIEPIDSQLHELADLQRVRYTPLYAIITRMILQKLKFLSQEGDMPLEELLNMYGYNFEECAPEILKVEESVSDNSTNLEASVPESNDCDDDDEPPKKRSKIRFLRDNTVSDTSTYS